MGIGSKPIHVKKLSVDSLTRRILQASDPRVFNRVHDIGSALCAETGVGNAVTYVERISNEYIARYQCDVNSS